MKNNLQYALDGNQLISGLFARGRRLIFVDDSGTQGKPLKNLATDFECLVGLGMDSGAYFSAWEAAQDLIKSIPEGVEEFHATDIINPKSDSGWRCVSMERRRDVLKGLFDVIHSNCAQVFLGYCSGEQLRNLEGLKHHPEIISKGPKKAVETVFRNCLIPHLLASSVEPIVVWDSVGAATEKMKIETLRFPESENFCEIMHADSRFVFGLQLADLLAFSYNRIFRIKDRAMRGSKHFLDDVIDEGVNSLKCIDILNL